MTPTRKRTRTTPVGYLALVVLTFAGCSRPAANLGKDEFPQQTNNRLYLFPDGQKESNRELSFYSDGKTIESIQVRYQDGGFLKVDFRPDGTARSLVEFFAPDADANTQLKRVIEYGADGKQVLQARFLREDGSLKAAGRILPSGRFEQLDYAENGQTLIAQRSYLSDGEVVFFRDFVDADNRSQNQELADGTKLTIEFRQDGTRLSRKSKKRSSQNELVYFYGEDGVTERFMVYRHQKISVVYFNEDGTLSHAREFASGGGMIVFVYRKGAVSDSDLESGVLPAGAVAYRQHWIKNYGIDSKEHEFVLDRVEKLNADGKVERRYKFDNRRKLSGVEYVNSDEKVVESHDLRDDGTVERIYFNEWADKDYPSSTRSQPVSKDEALKPDVDQTLFAPVDFVDPRPLVGPPV
ncbi:MAG: hypothetical protein K8F91_05805, partial [Candidatus Obscuribacterales bacterium]|nr:hypothetical protein [Candidatus Obscuribacterales bacterium]